MSPLPVVLITGCSAGGIGFELARALAASGAARVIATARDVSKMNGLEASAAAAAKAKAGGSDGDGSDGGGGGILALLPLDVTDEASVAQAAAQVLQLTAGNGCDILVNNAGMTFKGTALDSAVAETARLFDTNVFGLMRSTQAFSRGMVLRGRGLVVNVGSATGYVHQVTKSSYSASKHAVRCLTDTLRVELAPFNVRVMLRRRSTTRPANRGGGLGPGSASLRMRRRKLRLLLLLLLLQMLLLELKPELLLLLLLPRGKASRRSARRRRPASSSTVPGPPPGR